MLAKRLQFILIFGIIKNGKKQGDFIMEIFKLTVNQMLMMFALILTGYFLRKKKIIEIFFEIILIDFNII